MDNEPKAPSITPIGGPEMAAPASSPVPAQESVPSQPVTIAPGLDQSPKGPELVTVPVVNAAPLIENQAPAVNSGLAGTPEVVSNGESSFFKKIPLIGKLFP